MGMEKYYNSNNFKFYSYDKKMVENIHKNSNYILIKDVCLIDSHYSLLVIKIMKLLTSPIKNETDFLDLCNNIKMLEFDLNGVELNDTMTKDIFKSLYNLSQEALMWTDFRANLVEYLVFISLRFEGFTVKFEPDVKYKKKAIISRSKPFYNKEFDIGSYMNKQFFVLGECKTNLSSFVERKRGQTRLNKKVLQQVNKLTYLYTKILNSKTKNGDKVYCNRYLFVLNKINDSLVNAPNIKVIELEDLFEENFFLRDLGVA